MNHYKEWNPSKVGWKAFFIKLYDHHKPSGGALILRIALAVVFIPEGWSKLIGIDGTIKFLGMLGFAGPAGWAYLLGGVELVGGILLLVGLLTKPACVALAVDMAVIVFGLHMGKSMGLFWGHTYEFFILLTLLAMYIMGPGKYSLAHVIFKKHRPDQE